MPDPYRSLARRHLDQELAAARSLPIEPPDGWIRTIRNALGMSAADLGRRMGVSAQAITQYESAEQSGAIKLATLRKVAAALDADARYCIIPRDTLDDMVEQRAIEQARRELAPSSHSMALERQRPVEEDIDAMIRDRARELANSNRLWADE